MGDFLTAYAQVQPEKLAVVDDRPDGTVQAMTFYQLEEQANRLANVLAALGAEPGRKVVHALFGVVRRRAFGCERPGEEDDDDGDRQHDGDSPGGDRAPWMPGAGGGEGAGRRLNGKSRADLAAVICLPR